MNETIRRAIRSDRKNIRQVAFAMSILQLHMDTQSQAAPRVPEVQEVLIASRHFFEWGHLLFYGEDSKSRGILRKEPKEQRLISPTQNVSLARRIKVNYFLYLKSKLF